MKKTSILCVVLFLCAPLFAASLANPVERAVAAAIAAANQQVNVLAKLVKPVHSSDVMFRRPRGRDVVIATKQKEKACTGFWDENAQRLYIPSSCVRQDGYHVAALRLTFVGGRTVNVPGKSVKIMGDIAFVAL